MPGRVLIIDDDVGYSSAMARLLTREGHEVRCTHDPSTIEAEIQEHSPDAVVLDYSLGSTDGLSILTRLRQQRPDIVVVMATAYPEIEIAVAAMRGGAFDFMAKGSDPREGLVRIGRAVEVSELKRRAAESVAGTTSGSGGAAIELVGTSRAMRGLRDRLQLLREHPDTTVLILGETGTGKEVVARTIHASSARAYEPFVAVDCTTITPTLVESELFGHERGAFSGADRARSGRIEQAGQGTLFLDEIGDIEPGIQAKLLRLLEQRELVRVGGSRTIPMRARVLAATNRDLRAASQAGRFRSDLLFRLEVFVVELAPLREREDDVLVLAEHFGRHRARAMGRPEMTMKAEVADALRSYPFPGNIRELRNMMEQAAILARGDTLTLEHFPVLSRPGALPPAPHARDRQPEPRRAPPSEPPPSEKPPAPSRRAAVATASAIRASAENEDAASIARALHDARGNQSLAARSLGISRFQLIRRMRKYKML